MNWAPCHSTTWSSNRRRSELLAVQPRTRSPSHESAAAATTSTSFLRAWSPGTAYTEAFARPVSTAATSSGRPKASVSPCTTQIGTSTAVSSAARLFSGRPEDVAAVLTGRANASVYAVPGDHALKKDVDVVAAAGAMAQHQGAGRSAVREVRPRGAERRLDLDDHGAGRASRPSTTPARSGPVTCGAS